MTTDAKRPSLPDGPSPERPTPAVRTVKSFKRGKKRGRKFAGFFMAFGGGLVGTLCGIGSGMKDVIVELLPADEDEDEVGKRLSQRGSSDRVALRLGWLCKPSQSWREHRGCLVIAAITLFLGWCLLALIWCVLAPIGIIAFGPHAKTCPCSGCVRRREQSQARYDRMFPHSAGSVLKTYEEWVAEWEEDEPPA